MFSAYFLVRTLGASLTRIRSQKTLQSFYLVWSSYV